ncbi:hypothetical protein [Kluyvera sichuanensis]|uniref:hypothetical protein n=1 Tax=Kluyvera sichuanensis TaxID=2725494 RepID=UPI0034A41DB8
MSFARIYNTLCPYTGKKLIDLVSDLEHVLPAGLGAPKKFGVMASEEMNKIFNKSIDEPFLLEPFVRFISATNGVKSRSGKVVFSQKVTDEIYNEDVIVKFDSDNFTPQMMVPIRRGDDGEINAVVGYGDDAEIELEKIGKKLKSKGKTIVGKQFVTRSSNPLKINLSMDLNLFYLEQLKIAYLVAVFTFGDVIITSEQGRNIVKCLNNGVLENTNMQLNWSFLPEYLHPKTDKNIHTLFCFKTGEYVAVGISLFGKFTSSIFFMLSESLGNDNIGGVFYLDYKNNKMQVKDFVDHIIEVTAL